MKWVYFIKPIGMDGPIKIGCSINPQKRLASLESGSAFPLEIICTAPGGAAEENALHNLFGNHRMRLEWFAPAPELLALIENVRATGRFPEAADLLGLDPITDIFRAFDGATAVAAAIGAPLTTVCSWRTQNKRGIPTYRRGAVLAAIEDLGKTVQPSTLAYLKTPDRVGARS